jgi:hypothetical protein
MTEQSLIPSQPTQSTALSQPGEVLRDPVADLRHAMMTLPVDQQVTFLAEFKARRDHFRKWLMEQLVPGVHYGIPPGCEPKSKTIDGVVHYGNWNKKKNAYDWHPESQWKPKPSLYAGGADFVCDLLGLRDEYESDAVSWQQMGSKPGTAVQKCLLKSRATGELIGEGIGAYSNQSDANNAIKMAAKCAKVGAIINAYGLRDLFTQDEPKPQPNDNPEADPAAPRAASRAERKAAVSAPVYEKLAARKRLIGRIAARWRDEVDAGGKPVRDALVAGWSKEEARRQFRNWCRIVSGNETLDPEAADAWTEADDAAFVNCEAYFEQG